MNYWLMKTEEDVFSIDDLKNSKKSTTTWDGVRNYEARNFMRDQMKLGDLVFIYHSNAKPSGIVGLATVVKTSYPDHTQFDETSEYYDPKSTQENPRWYMVDVKFKEKFKEKLSLEEIKAHPLLQDTSLIKRSRLSVMPMAHEHAEVILKSVK